MDDMILGEKTFADCLLVLPTDAMPTTSYAET